MGGRPVRGTMFAYYSRGGKARAAAFPVGLKMLAGDPAATRPQRLGVVAWQCVGGPRATRRVDRVPHCQAGERLAVWILFPDCWDGRRIDSHDHRSHMAYARAGRCPATHPVGLMKLVVRVEWPARPRERGVRLGGTMSPHTMHADFWNTWHQPTLRQLRWDCIETSAPCGQLHGRPTSGINAGHPRSRLAVGRH
jgi:hypothetical protein